MTLVDSISRDMTLREIDPRDAWASWAPSDREPWNLQRVCLLHRRAGFGTNAHGAKSALEHSPQWCIDEQLLGSNNTEEASKSFEVESSAILRSVTMSSESHKLAAWWIHRMLHSPTPALEKITLFWHGHFATGAEKVQDAELMYNQNRLIRQLGLGRFNVLIHAIAKDPAMLIYLDSVNNRKAHPNENFARELMELFCLGEGHYSEADVQQLAKCFTGWEIRRKQFRFNPFQHDETLKKLFQKNSATSGEEAIDCVVNHPAMPEFIVRKLFQFFISDEDIPEPALIEPLVQFFRESSLTIGPLVRKILSSRLLLSGWSIGKKIRSPLELIVGWMRMMHCTTNLELLEERLRHLGQALFYPPNVKGWEGGRSWINSSTLVGRANLLHEILNHEKSRFQGGTLQQFCARQNCNSADEVRRLFEDVFLAQPIHKVDGERLAQQDALSTQENRLNRAFSFFARLPLIHLS